MNAELPTLATTLKQQGYSLTKTRQLVFNALTDSDALSMNQLIRKLQHKMDRASVYRTVDLFEKIGIVNRLQIGWKYKLELSEIFAGHHHHASCMQCGKVVAFEESPELENDIHKLAETVGFSLTSHSLELRGLCPTCHQDDN
ncbi:MAG TPA: Fur family transcriptional regulator [Verrucomicrobiae bacterium]|nr:Fur family transcriptional regulator [Verrucomicrobiae bacterium]